MSRGPKVASGRLGAVRVEYCRVPELVFEELGELGRREGGSPDRRAPFNVYERGEVLREKGVRETGRFSTRVDQRPEVEEAAIGLQQGE